MKSLVVSLAALFSLSLSATALPALQQLPFAAPSLEQADLVHLDDEPEEGVGHLSEWARETKARFIKEVKENNASHWTVVMGNEAGDLDSMTSALLWAFHLSHLKKPVDAIALLQTEADALDLRPENTLALANANMSPKHRDLLNIDELPIPVSQVAERIKGIVLVDHNQALSAWRNATVLSIFDHHVDRKLNLDASPRIIEPTGSCSSIVAREVLRHKHHNWHGKHLPHELADMVLSVIALDTDAFRKGNDADKQSCKKMLPLSSWAGYKLKVAIKKLDKEMSKAKKDLGHLSVRDLLRRDWKGDLVESADKDDDSAVHLGFASVPVSLSDMVERTETNNTLAWAAIESAWTGEIHADISVALTSYKEIDPSTGEKVKRREVFVAVRHDRRLDSQGADSLFEAIVKEIDTTDVIQVTPWRREGIDEEPDWGRRRRAWNNLRQDGGRKVMRPLIEKAVQGWLDEQAKK